MSVNYKNIILHLVGNSSLNSSLFCVDAQNRELYSTPSKIDYIEFKTKVDRQSLRLPMLQFPLIYNQNSACNA